MRDRIKKMFESLPLIGGLAYASRKDYGEPTKEFFYTWVLSSLPIFFSVFVQLVGSLPAPPESNSTGSISKLAEMFYANLNTGEVFIYATAFLAPVGFLMYKYNRDEIRLHNHLSFLLTVVITIAASALMFGLQRGGVIKNRYLMDLSGLVLYIIAAAVWFLALVYDNLRLDYANQKRAQENDLQNKLKGFQPHGGGK